MRTAFDSSPGDGQILAEMVGLLEKAGRREDALSFLKRVVVGVDRSRATKAWIARAMFERGELDEAISLFRGLAAGQNSASAYNDLAYALLGRGNAADLAEARRWAEQALRLAPQSANARDTLARLEQTSVNP